VIDKRIWEIRIVKYIYLIVPSPPKGVESLVM